MEYGYNYVPNEPPRNPIGCIVAVILALLFCALLGSCKAPQSTIRERVVYDTVWTEKAAQSTRNDSVVIRERVQIVPHVIRVGDTTIVYSDTTIVRATLNNRYITRNVYQGEGTITHDTAYVEKKATVSKKENAAKDSSHKWRLLWVGFAIGIILSLLVIYRKAVVCFIRRLAKRN